MADFDQWNFAATFTAVQAALLIEGKDPNGLDEHGCDDSGGRWVSDVILKRLSRDYADTRANYLDPYEPKPRFPLPSDEMNRLLERVATDDGFEEDLIDWLGGESSRFTLQEFSRDNIHQWLTECGLPSQYEFELNEPPTTAAKLASTNGGTLQASSDLSTPNDVTKKFTAVDELINTEIDPLDLPLELDAAMMAFRAVLNGYGNTSETFKNRLINYLEKNFTDLKPEAVQRIATVANPDKTTGRKKRDKE